MFFSLPVGAEGVDDLPDAVVDVAQGLELLLPVDAVGVPVVEGEVARFADEPGLVGDVALVEAFFGVVRQRRPGTSRSGAAPAPGRPAAEVAVRGGVVELEVEGLFGRRWPDFGGRDVGQRVGDVVAGLAVGRRERAADVVADPVFAGFPVPGSPNGPTTWPLMSIE